MKAMLGDTVIAEAHRDDLIRIEGNWYFPPAAVNTALLEKSDTAYTCAWKGHAQYFTVKTGDAESADAAFSYPQPHATSFDRVGQDFSNYVAFWKDVRVVD
ncbi:DUF427 domain-containing protein [Salinibacterium sp. ZJ454]|uniref:DUF427 domain-containing protein n=1 Tax=Salinibacterium sp. ZJ454 TaxID=2708339 RepID=UPI00141EDE7C|nr:DUF427 domain-containing protein [Salinibacterium sp. ZJ454]